MKFKTSREQEEFGQLLTKNTKLMRVLGLLDNYTQLEFGKEVTLTSIFRTAQEQADLYKDSAVKVTNSPHMFWKAADLRASDFTDQERAKMQTFLNCFSYTLGQGRPVCIIHQIAGNALHFHIQCD